MSPVETRIEVEAGWLEQIAFSFVWTVRQFARNDRLLRHVEDRVQQRMLSRPAVSGSQREVRRMTGAELSDRTAAAEILARNEPVVIEGLQADCTAVRDWSIDALVERCGDSLVTAVKQSIDESAAVECYSSEPIQLTFACFVERMRQAERIFVPAMTTLFRDHPEMLDELGIADMERLFGKRVIRPEIFVAGPQSRSYFHCAAGGNLFTQVHGRKRWVFVAPRHTMWMSPIVGYPQTGSLFASPVITCHNEHLYPLYQQVTRYVTEVSPGDVVYTPPWWWHEVSNLCESIGVPLRIPVVGPLRNNNWLFSALLMSTPTALASTIDIARSRLSLDDTMVARSVTPSRWRRRH